MADLENDLRELRAVAAAVEALGRDPAAFNEAYEAFQRRDAARFDAVLDRGGLAHECRRPSFLFCEKRCIGVCRRLCPDAAPPATAGEIREFVAAFSQALRN